MKKVVLLALTIFASLFLFSQSFAASFQSLEQSAARLGNADAGSATNTNDAAIEYYNPAGMAFVGHTAISASLIGVFANISMHNASATDFSGAPTTGKTKGPVSEGPMMGFHFVRPMGDRGAWGIGVTTPYGLETLYKNDSITRYFATKSIIQTVNLALSMAFKLNDKLAVGVGFDAQYLWAELDQAADIGSLIGPIWYNQGGPKDIQVENQGHDWGYGYNLGLFYNCTKNTQLGLAYRSEIKHSLKGTSRIAGIEFSQMLQNMAKGLNFYNGSVSSDITLPASLVASAQHNINPRWTVMTDVQYTFWSVLKKITLHLSAQANSPQTVMLKYHDTWRFAIGQSYKINPKWTIRNGFAFDETPTDSTYKTARIPGANRYWITLGANYKPTPRLNVDVGYGLILFAHSSINLPAQSPAPGYPGPSLKAKFRAIANLIGVQLNYHFAS